MPKRTDISAILLCAAACAGCGGSSLPAPPETQAEREAVLDRIASECSLPRTALTLVGEDQLRFQPAPDARFESVECVLQKVAATNIHLQTTNVVGNETPAPGANDAQAH